MFIYNFHLALLSIRHNPIISALMVAAIATGIGAFMTTYTVYYYMSANPIPHKSKQLYAVQLDNRDDKGQTVSGPQEVETQITYTDAINLIQAETPASQQVIMTRMRDIIKPEDQNIPAFSATIRASYTSFFSMFEVPFLYGGGWQNKDDHNAKQVIVLSKRINDKLFGGNNSVGKTLYMGEYYYKIVGVADDWYPMPKFYDINNGRFSGSEDVYLPFSTAIQQQLHHIGNVSCWQSQDPGFEAFLQSECVWIQMWAQLETQQQADQYIAYLNRYTEQQKLIGRFPRTNNHFISPVMHWLEINDVVSEDSKVLVALASMFLLVCLCTTAGLLLSKLFTKAPEISLKRALGASRLAIFEQYLVEFGLLGITGGIAGLALAYLGLHAVAQLYSGYHRLVMLDVNLMLLTLILSITTSIIAGLYPGWRVCRLPPAYYLKIQ